MATVDQLYLVYQAVAGPVRWLCTPIWQPAQGLEITRVDVISWALGIAAAALSSLPVPRRRALRLLRFLFIPGQILSALAAVRFLGLFLLLPFAIMAILHCLCLAAQVRAFTALRNAGRADDVPR